MSWRSSCGASSPCGDQQILGQRQLPLAEDGVGLGQQFLRFALGGIGEVALAADGQQQRMDPGGIDGMDLARTPGTTVGISGPVSSWMKAPKVVSSCGGRPTVVKGQMAPGRW